MPPSSYKKCANRSQRTKTQIPVVAKQTIYRFCILQYYFVYGICILSNSSQNSIVKKGYKYPKKRNTPIDCIFSLFGTTIISQFLIFVNIFREISPNQLLKRITPFFGYYQQKMSIKITFFLPITLPKK